MLTKQWKKLTIFLALTIILALSSGYDKLKASAEGEEGTVKVVANESVSGKVVELLSLDIPYQYETETSALQILENTIGAENVVVSNTTYGKMINGIKGIQMKGNYFWAFYVNGISAQVGADQYIVQKGDQLAFQYESFGQTEESSDGNASDSTSSPISADQLQIAIDQASNHIIKNQIGEWDAIVLAKSGQKIPANYLKDVTKLIVDKKGKFSKITDYERYTLGILAAGGNPSNVGGYNLVSAIYNGDVTKQGLNGVFYGLIALDSGKFSVPSNAKWTRENLVAYLLSKQGKDGGWSWDGSVNSDIDTTAMVLTALTPYKAGAKVKSAMDVAVKYLSSQYQLGKIDNSSSAAQVVIALSTLGMDTNGELFTKNNVTIVDQLLSYQNKDGGYDWQGGETSDLFSTSQALQALVSLQLKLTSKSPLFQLSEAPENGGSNGENQDEVETPGSSESNSLGSSGSNDGKESGDVFGKRLPNTATNSYNYLFFGLILFLIGGLIFILEKRKKA